MMSQVDIAGGQVSGVDDLSSAPSSVINWEVDESGVNRMRPGLGAYALTGFGTSPVIGIRVWKSYLILVTEDRKIWAIHQSLPTVVRAVSDATAATQLEGDATPTFAVGENYVYIAGGKRIQRWAPALTYSEVISASPECTHVASIGQRLVANDIASPQGFRWSDIGEGVWDSWPAANTTDADARPDPVVAIYENTNELLVFGTETLQTYQVGADPTLPFDQASTVNLGISAYYSVCRFDQDFVFFDDKRRLIKCDGRTYEDLSDAIHKDLRGLSTISDLFVYREERAQHSLLTLRCPTDERTFVLNLKSKAWRESRYYAQPFQTDYPVGSYAYWPAIDEHMHGLSTASGGLATLDADTREDLDGPLVCERTTGWQDHGSAGVKRSLRLRISMRRGTAAEGATPGIFEVRVQNDDGPWSEWEQISVGGPGDFDQIQDAYVGGIFYRRRYSFRYTGTDDISIVGLWDDVDALEEQEAA